MMMANGRVGNPVSSISAIARTGNDGEGTSASRNHSASASDTLSEVFSTTSSWLPTTMQ